MFFRAGSDDAAQSEADPLNLEAVRAMVGPLVEALRPFAALGAKISSQADPDGYPSWCNLVTVGAFKDAHEAYCELKGDGHEG